MIHLAAFAFALTLCRDSGCTPVAQVEIQLSPLVVNGQPATQVAYDLDSGRVTAYEQVIHRDSFE